MNNARLKRLKYIGQKVADRTKDSFYNFTHAQLIRNMVDGTELDLIKREPFDKDLILIAFYPTGGFGDYIISSKLLDELLLSVPCRIDVYCENMVFGQAIYGTRPGVQILPYDCLHGNRMIYDLLLRVEHFVHILSWNAHHASKVCPEFVDKIRALGRSMNRIRPEIEQQWFREGMHFRRCQFLGVNRWTELRHGSVFQIADQYTYVDLKPEYLERISELKLADEQYITVNRGADSMGRSTMQTKVWPQEYYNEFVALFKVKYPNIKVIQLGTANNAKIKGVDKYVLGESMEVTKWVLRGSRLHIDCEGGLVHLATQMATKCIVLFGPTPSHMYAYPTNINLVSDKCSNCMGTHPDWAFACYKGLRDPECMYSLMPAYVMQHADAYLEECTCAKEKDIEVVVPKREENADFMKQYERCHKRNSGLTYEVKHEGVYSEVYKRIENEKSEWKIAIVNAGRDYIGWYLTEQGCSVTEFDKNYGFSGRQGDTTFNQFTRNCIKNGMDMRLGDQYNLPYASEQFDLVIWFSDVADTFGSDGEMRRVLKNQGILIKSSDAE